MPHRAGFPLPAALLALLLTGSLAGAEPIPPADRRSGFDQMGPGIQAMQRDDDTNPAMLSVADGAKLWTAVPATGRPACAGCHGEAAASTKDVAARYVFCINMTFEKIYDCIFRSRSLFYWLHSVI